MSSNNRLVVFQRALARKSLISFSRLFNHLSYGFVGFLTNCLLTISYPLIFRHRKIAKESMDIAFGNTLSLQEKRKIIRKCFKNFGFGMMEMLFFMAHPDQIANYVSMEGRHHVDEALKKGKGVIAVTAHYGNFPLMMYYCAQAGFSTNSIIRMARDQELAKFLLEKKREAGLKTIYTMPRGECVSNSLKVLRNNEVLFIPIDQNFGAEGGVYVDFFGQKASTATGPVVFALRTGATILPMFIVRNEDNTHTIIVEPPLTIEEKQDEEATVVHNMGRITRIIEQYIRKYPYEWAWMHRRWKTRPTMGTAT